VTAVFTIGHSNRPLEVLISLLRANGVTLLVDIRTVPRSRHNAQYNRETLPGSLQPSGIGYLHMPALGGLRHPRRDSINSAWQNDSFRGYADYMQTPEFAGAVKEVMALARSERVALMCAEAVPWRCHRSLVADALSVRGVEVRHIMSAASVKPHSLTSFARVDGEAVTYPGVI
jgi:uncharacterized protein (DUF488 family)